MLLSEYIHVHLYIHILVHTKRAHEYIHTLLCHSNPYACMCTTHTRAKPNTHLHTHNVAPLHDEHTQIFFFSKTLKTHTYTNAYFNSLHSRNPEPSSRPSFRDILVSLTQDHSKVMTIPREDARSHPKATTLGGHLHAGQDMYGDLQNSYASGADEIDNRMHPNGAPTWSNGEGIELTHSDEQMEESTRNDSTTDQLCEGMYDRVNEVVGNAELYEGMEGCATEGVYDSASVHEEPTYDVVHDSIHLP